MKNFDRIVDSILSEGFGLPTRSENPKAITGSQFIKNMIRLAQESSPEAAKELEDSILNSGEYKDILDEIIDTPQKLADLAEVLGIAVDMTKLQNPQKPDNSYNQGSGFKKPAMVNRGPLKGLGFKRGSYYMADIEQAFWDSAYDWNQGTILKKLQMALSPLKGLMPGGSDMIGFN